MVPKHLLALLRRRLAGVLAGTMHARFRLGHPGVHPVEVSPEGLDLPTVRLLWIVLVLFASAFSAVYHLLSVSSGPYGGVEMGMAAVGLGVVVASYRLRSVQRHSATLLGLGCYGATLWFVAEAAWQQFTPAHAVGLLFIVPGLGAVYSLSLRHVWPLALYFAATVAAAVAGLAVVPAHGVDAFLFGGALAAIALVAFVAAGARLRAEHRFVATEERYRAVVEQATDGIYLMDATTLRFLDANPSFRRMVGYELDALRTMTLADLAVDPSEARGASGGGGHAGRPGVTERVLRSRDGRTVYTEQHVDRIMYGERPVLSVMVRDVSLRRQYEHRLIVARAKAEEIARFKSSLLTNMSHEIRTPLSSILGWASVLGEEVTEAHRELVALIEQSGQRLHNTLDAVLELAHLDANGMELQPVELDVSAEVAEVLRTYERQARRKRVSLTLAGPPAAVHARVDAACLHRLLTHVIDNAVKFTEEGRVTVTLAEEEGDVRVCVEDTGVGIGEAFLPHVFDEFRQESQGLARAHEGTGLGLAIARRLAELLGGAITVESTPGVGTRVTMVVPGALPASRDGDAYREVA